MKEPSLLCGLDYILTEIEFISKMKDTKEFSQEYMIRSLKHLKFLVNNYF